MKILYIAREFNRKETGATVVMRRNLKVIKKIVGESNLIEYYLPKVSIMNFISSLITNRSYGITQKNEQEIITMSEQEQPDYIFIESSSYGSLIKALSKKNFKTICFAHNVDTILAKSELKSRNPLISIPKYLSTSRGERIALKYCTRLISLSDRDSNNFNKLFGREADLIIPITFPSFQSLDKINKEDIGDYFLFVGSNFFPNVEGIIWFIKNVATHVNLRFKIVGSCCENLKIKKLDIPQNVEIVGYAQNLEQEYINAAGVIIPIFKGSGMKTKTIEALRYSKSIFGTEEAFAGIDCKYSLIGGKCNTADEFIISLNNASLEIFNEYSNELFNENFSDDSIIEKIRNLLYNE